MEFAALPEWFVEDMAEVLLAASRYAPHTLASARMDDMMLFMVGVSQGRGESGGRGGPGAGALAGRMPGGGGGSGGRGASGGLRLGRMRDGGEAKGAGFWGSRVA